MQSSDDETISLSISVSPGQQRQLEAAATAVGLSVSSFIREAATRAAGEILADRTRFVLPPERLAAFSAALERPPRSLPELRALLSSPSPLDPR